MQLIGLKTLEVFMVFSKGSWDRKHEKKLKFEGESLKITSQAVIHGIKNLDCFISSAKKKESTYDLKIETSIIEVQSKQKQNYLKPLTVLTDDPPLTKQSRNKFPFISIISPAWNKLYCLKLTFNLLNNLTRGAGSHSCRKTVWDLLCKFLR